MPAVGKTTLMCYIADKLFKEKNIPIFILTGWPEDKVREAGGWEKYLENQTGIYGHKWLSTRAYLFIDEAQESYWDEELWVSLFKSVSINHNGPWIVTFSSYGPPGGGGYAGLNNSNRRFQKIHARFGPERSLSFRPNFRVSEFGMTPIGLLLTPQEAEPVVKLLSHSNGVKLANGLKIAVLRISGYHAGAVCSLIEVISKKSPVSLEYGFPGLVC